MEEMMGSVFVWVGVGQQGLDVCGVVRVECSVDARWCEVHVWSARCLWLSAVVMGSLCVWYGLLY